MIQISAVKTQLSRWYYSSSILYKNCLCPRIVSFQIPTVLLFPGVDLDKAIIFLVEQLTCQDFLNDNALIVRVQ